MASPQKTDGPTLAVFDVETGHTIPVPLEDEGVNTIEWLVEKLENISGIVHTTTSKKPCRVKVRKLVVGDLEIKHSKWAEKTIDYYLLFGDPWFAKITLLPTPSRAELAQEEETATSTVVWEGEAVNHYLVSAPNEIIPRFGYACGVEFVDLNTGPTRREWSSKAPKWRRANPGLCIEGKCESERCEAFDKMVVINCGFVQFSLAQDAHTCQCPLCQQHVTPVTCAFNNCKWKWAGIRYVDPTKPPERIQLPDWQTADNAYHIFQPTSTAKQHVKWQQLTVRTKRLDDKNMLCPLCVTESQIRVADTKELICGHHFHTRCYDRVCALISQAQLGASDSDPCLVCIQQDVHKEYMAVGDIIEEVK